MVENPYQNQSKASDQTKVTDSSSFKGGIQSSEVASLYGSVGSKSDAYQAVFQSRAGGSSGESDNNSISFASPYASINDASKGTQTWDKSGNENQSLNIPNIFGSERSQRGDGYARNGGENSQNSRNRNDSGNGDERNDRHRSDNGNRQRDAQGGGQTGGDGKDPYVTPKGATTGDASNPSQPNGDVSNPNQTPGDASTGTPTTTAAGQTPGDASTGTPTTIAAGQTPGDASTGTPTTTAAGQTPGDASTGTPTTTAAGQTPGDASTGTPTTIAAGQTPGDASTGTPTTIAAGQTPGDASTGTPTTTAAASGQFTLGNGQIIGPNGQVFVAKGLNDTSPDAVSNISQMLQNYPGLNFVRLNSSPSGSVFGTPGGSVQAIENTINQLTSKGIVVEVEDHSTDANTQPNTLSGSALQTQLNWYSQIASAEKNNPDVWFGTPNEPMGTNANIDTQINDVYNAIRSTGNNNPILIENTGGGEPGDIQADASSLANMTNVGYDAHFYQNSYGANDGPNNPNDLSGALAGIVNADQAVQTGDPGKAPVIVGEYGPATNDTTQDSNGMQVVSTVVNSASTGETSGSAAWIYNDPNTNGNQLVNPDGQYTAYGAAVAAYINSNNA